MVQIDEGVFLGEMVRYFIYNDYNREQKENLRLIRKRDGSKIGGRRKSKVEFLILSTFGGHRHTDRTQAHIPSGVKNQGDRDVHNALLKRGL